MSNPCSQCGNPGDPIEATIDGELAAVGNLCDSCLEIALEGADFLRAKFEALLAEGMSRKRANEVMIRWWIPLVHERCGQERRARGVGEIEQEAR